MRKITGKIVIFIFFTLVVIVGLFIIPSVDTKTPDQELKVSGLVIKFEEGTTESEVKTILENCSISMYRLDYDVEDIADKYYIKVENNKNITIREELKSATDVKKGDYDIISISEQAIDDENFLEMLDKNDIQLKKFVWCYISFDNKSKDWIPEEDAVKIKNELKMNEKVLNVFLNSLEG
ncbi:UPF0228 family protein [Methanosarcina sp.]|uniref:UPF0228 family protein n=1 Tax=Methanosarcina sp. TaxID=2213 RepID=UPI002AB7F8CE|nr:UPF0228 family protein [Methanosarcina sp.]MDY9926813.1 UPF0228 family protein [Methanosarcina sp.]